MYRAVVDFHRSALAAPAFELGGGVRHRLLVVALKEVLVGVSAAAFLAVVSTVDCVPGIAQKGRCTNNVTRIPTANRQPYEFSPEFLDLGC